MKTTATAAAVIGSGSSEAPVGDLALGELVAAAQAAQGRQCTTVIQQVLC
jgi:hypothetical protein